jgi:hypothetical protein
LSQRWQSDPAGVLVSIPGLPDGDPRRSTLGAVLDGLGNAVDAAADAVTAEGVFQMVRGNFARAAGSLDAISSGQAAPPDLGFVRTPRTGIGLTHRVALLVSADDQAIVAGWAESSPRAAADPALAAWAARLLGPAGDAAAAVHELGPDGAVTATHLVALTALNLTAIDLVWATAGVDGPPPEILARVLDAALRAADGPDPGANLRVQLGELGVLLELASRGQRLLAGARPVDGADLQPPHAEPSRGLDLDEYQQRVVAAEQALAAAQAALTNALAGNAADDAGLRAAMLQVAAFGVTGSMPAPGLPLDVQARTLVPELTRRPAPVSRAEPPDDEARRDQLLDRLRTVFGPGYLALPRFVAPNAAELEASLADADALVGDDPLAAYTWLQRMSRVRLPLSRMGRALQGAEVLRTGEALDLPTGRRQAVDRGVAQPGAARDPRPHAHARCQPGPARRRRALPASGVLRVQRRRRRRLHRLPAAGQVAMPSITTWWRLEPQTAGEDVALGYAAQGHDPLWLLPRQWQVAEFQGEDAGTPIIARWRARVSPVTRYVAGPIPPNTSVDAGPYDASLPLQTQVERQPLAQSATAEGLDGLRLAVESGLQFLRFLRLQYTSEDRTDAFTTAYPVLPLTDQQRAAADPETVSYADFVAGRALDGRRLRTAFGNPANPRLDPALDITPGDRAEALEAARAWLAWEDSLFSLPVPADQAWQSDRLEYKFNLSTRLGDDVFGERTLTAAQYDDGALDWHSFDFNGQVNMGTGHDQPAPIVTRTVVPAPVSLHGMPAPRFWELEDAPIDLGALQPGATDLGQLLLVETLTGFGNDRFVVPIDLPVGSLVESRSLVVTDTFGVRTLLGPVGDPNLAPRGGWSMFSFSLRADPGDLTGVPLTNLFYLPPTLVRPLEGPVLEEVMLLRDELANLGWAVERRLESPLQVGVETAKTVIDLEPPPPAPRDAPLYRLATALPAHWVPLLPVRVTDGGHEVRLARGAALDLDGEPHAVPAQARLLDVGDPAGRLLIPEEEVPREGVVVRRSYHGTTATYTSGPRTAPRPVGVRRPAASRSTPWTAEFRLPTVIHCEVAHQENRAKAAKRVRNLAADH